MRRRPFVLFILLVVLFLSAEGIARLATDWQWFANLGFLELFLRPTFIQIAVYAAVFVVVSAFVYFNLAALTRHLMTPRPQWELAQGRLALLFQRLPALGRRVQMVVAGGVGLLWALSFAGFWQQTMYFFAGQPTGVQEPLYRLDVSFYLFRLPFYQQIVGSLLSLAFLTLIAVALVYLLQGVVTWQQFRRSGFPRGSWGPLRHLNLLLGLVMLLLGLNAFLGRYQLLFSQRGAVFGAGFADVYLSQYVYLVLAVLGLLGFAVSLVGWKAPRYRLLASLLVMFMVISVGGSVAAAVVQTTVVSPNELTREYPFIEKHLEMTRRAYRLDQISEETWELAQEYQEAGENGSETEPEGAEAEGPGEADLDGAEAAVSGEGELAGIPAPELDPEVVANMRLMDYRPLRDVYREAQEYRRYYHFNDVDIARYTVDGEYHQVMLSAREMDVDRLPDEAQTPVNRHLKYTHGYGLAMSPVSEPTPGGLPRYHVQDMPLQDNLGLGIERPELYFGELTNDFVVVNTDVNEFHYPGQEDVEINYQADQGVNMNLANRLLFALREKSGLLLFSGEYSADSQILVRRNIQERAARIAPFLDYDQDPYLVVADGQLYWIMEAYTSSENYPYSRPFSETQNYLANPVKVVVDAYSGEVSFYLVQENEPFTRALDRAFPELFDDPEDLSPELRAQFRYAHPYFSAQVEMMKNYHMTDPVIFYNREDAWDTPTESYHGESIAMEPYYATLRLPGHDQAEFVLMMPYTPVARNNMVAWLGARNDGDNYGELVLYRFPAGSLVYGPQQIDARIDQQPEISQQFSLWDGQGSSVIRGNMLAIPLSSGVIYIEPVYLQAEDSPFPEMRRVIAAWGDQVVMEENLEAALAELGTRVGGEELQPEADPDREPEDVPDPEEEAPPERAEDLEAEFATIRELVDELLRLEEEAAEALQEGDWARYGELQEEMRERLQELDRKID